MFTCMFYGGGGKGWEGNAHLLKCYQTYIFGRSSGG